MSDRGVFAVSRGVFDHAMFKPEPFTEVQAWIWLVSEAAWQPRRTRVGRAVIDLGRGQLAHSRRHLAKTWRWDESRVRRFLDRLEKDQMIERKTTHEATNITICNYDDWQFGRPAEQPAGDPLATHSRPARDPITKKEIKEEGKKEETAEARKRATRLPDDWMPSEADGRYAVDKGLTPAEAQHEFEKFRNYWTAKSGQAATKIDWSATWRNWILTTIERKGKPNGNGGNHGRQTLSDLARDLADEARQRELAAGLVRPDVPFRSA